MRGRVFLIGAGPGDPELMTLKAARALRLADVVLIDDLVNRGCLAHAHSNARIIEVGKRGGCKSTSQAFIHRLLVLFSKEGKTVARLKGGDPFVFGRGGEELEALRAAGVEVEVIPGITAGMAVPATLGIPVTHRDMSRGVTLVTGHGKNGADAHECQNWAALARAGTTLVIYMGLKRLPEIATALMLAGMKPGTPACAIENGTLKGQRQVIGSLATLPELVLESALRSPAIVVIGDVVCLANKSITENPGRQAA